MILRMTIAVKNMEGMVAFYESVFGLKFKSENLFGAVLYHAKWNNLEIQFCPAEIAKNTAKQNRHQLEIKVDNLSSSF